MEQIMQSEQKGNMQYEMKYVSSLNQHSVDKNSRLAN